MEQQNQQTQALMAAMIKTQDAVVAESVKARQPKTVDVKAVGRPGEFDG